MSDVTLPQPARTMQAAAADARRTLMPRSFGGASAFPGRGFIRGNLRPAVDDVFDVLARFAVRRLPVVGVDRPGPRVVGRKRGDVRVGVNPVVTTHVRSKQRGGTSDRVERVERID